MHAPVQILYPGDVFLAERGERLETLLGSCVSVLLIDARHTVGVMSHIVSVARPAVAASRDTRFAPAAMQTMFSLLHAKGFQATHCQAWLIGGGNMFPQMKLNHRIGSDNVNWVRAYLKNAGIPIVGESVQGSCYRKVCWTIGDMPPDIEVVPVEVQSHPQYA